ncbi:MAG: methylated-DNA--[protein]-cysteine S-methyltransferase [Pontixanthobacter sp.]
MIDSQTIRYEIIETNLGSMLLAATDAGVCRLSFEETRADLQTHFPKAELVEGGGDFGKLRDRVAEAVELGGPVDDIPLDTNGTAFQERVWAALRAIPAGETRSYRDIAEALGNSKATRAVGGANGANAIAVLIPCHRVIAADGSQGGYAYGSQIKRDLLQRERDTVARGRKNQGAA